MEAKIWLKGLGSSVLFKFVCGGGGGRGGGGGGIGEGWGEHMNNK